MKITKLAYLGTFILVVAFSTSAVSQVPASGMMKSMKGVIGNMMNAAKSGSMMGGGNMMMGGGHSMMGGGKMMKSDGMMGGMSSMHGNEEGGHAMMKDMCPMMGGSGTAMHKGDKNTGDKKPQIKKDKKDSRL